jgi:hypothetical protein
MRDFSATDFAALNPGPSSCHPGEPHEDTYNARDTLPPFSHRDSQSYKFSDGLFTPDLKAVDVARDLYHFGTEIGQIYVAHTKNSATIRGERQIERRLRFYDHCVAVVARSLLHTARDFTSVLPLRLQYKPSQPAKRSPCHYGLLMTRRDGSQTILPLHCHFLGAKERRFQEAWLYHQADGLSQ